MRGARAASGLSFASFAEAERPSDFVEVLERGGSDTYGLPFGAPLVPKGDALVGGLRLERRGAEASGALGGPAGGEPVRGVATSAVLGDAKVVLGEVARTAGAADGDGGAGSRVHEERGVREQGSRRNLIRFFARARPNQASSALRQRQRRARAVGARALSENTPRRWPGTTLPCTVGST